jgi:hypothetical protein
LGHHPDTNRAREICHVDPAETEVALLLEAVLSAASKSGMTILLRNSEQLQRTL